MRRVNRRSALSTTIKAPSWLEEAVYAPRRTRTAQLVQSAVETLVAQRKKNHITRISLQSIVAMSRHVDPDGKGVSHTAILGNPEARAIYEQHRTAPPQRRRRQPKQASDGLIHAVKIDRNQQRARQRYNTFTKDELIQRVLLLEQSYAEQQERWS